MKKNVNKAFMLVETLVVTTFIFAFLMVIFVQFKSINNSYSRSFKYNMPNSLYKTNVIKKYLDNIDYTDLKTALVGNYYVDFTSCNSAYVNDVSYCLDLIDKTEIQKILFTKEDLSGLKTILTTNRIFDEELNLFVEYIKYEGIADEYRIIAQFADGSFATLML